MTKHKSTHLTSDLLLDALLRLGQSRHGGHVGPAEGSHHRLQHHVAKELPDMCEEHIQDSIPNLEKRWTERKGEATRPNVHQDPEPTLERLCYNTSTCVFTVADDMDLRLC